jgi:hypothetical protein
MSSERLPLTVTPIERVVAVDELQHGRGEPLPLEVGLVAGQQQERLADLVGREIELQGRGPVVAEVVVVEVDEGTACAEVEQLVAVERDDLAVVERVEQVFAQLRDRRAGIRESHQPGDKVQALGHVEDVVGEVEEASRILHGSILIARLSQHPVPHDGGVMLTANTRGAVVGTMRQ